MEQHVIHMCHKICNVSTNHAGTKVHQQNRHRVAISDGDNWATSFLASELNDLVDSGAIHNGTLIRAIQYMVKSGQDLRRQVLNSPLQTCCRVLAFTPLQGQVLQVTCPFFMTDQQCQHAGVQRNHHPMLALY